MLIKKRHLQKLLKVFNSYSEGPKVQSWEMKEDDQILKI